MDTKGKIAIVTGGAVRLGRAMALALAERGAHVVVHYNASAGPAQQVVEQIAALGVQSLAVQADLSKPRLASTVVERTVAHFGRADILVNSAAIFEPGNWDDTDEENWDRHFDINLKSPFFLTQAFASKILTDQVRTAPRAHVVNIIDWTAVYPGVDHLAYTLTKAGLWALTQSLAQALAPNIQVNAIAPGMILPPPGKGPDYLTENAPKIPLKRPGSAEEIVKALLYLLDADFVTGQMIYVTGGRHLLKGYKE
ncbi:MAG: SDR family oxidoreductase [Anaerolineae bacterium]|nr:SDR family oxidoreductase [Anaerolineae bacterium]